MFALADAWTVGVGTSGSLPSRITRVEIEFQRNTQSEATNVAGALSIDGGQTTSFVGWIELLSLLEHSLHAG